MSDCGLVSDFIVFGNVGVMTLLGFGGDFLDDLYVLVSEYLVGKFGLESLGRRLWRFEGGYCLRFYLLIYQGLVGPVTMYMRCIMGTSDTLGNLVGAFECDVADPGLFDKLDDFVVFSFERFEKQIGIGH